MGLAKDFLQTSTTTKFWAMAWKLMKIGKVAQGIYIYIL